MVMLQVWPLQALLWFLVLGLRLKGKKKSDDASDAADAEPDDGNRAGKWVI